MDEEQNQIESLGGLWVYKDGEWRRRRRFGRRTFALPRRKRPLKQLGLFSLLAMVVAVSAWQVGYAIYPAVLVYEPKVVSERRCVGILDCNSHCVCDEGCWVTVWRTETVVVLLLETED